MPGGFQFNENNRGRGHYLPWTVPVESDRYDAEPATEQSSNRRIDKGAFHGIPSTSSNVKHKNRRENRSTHESSVNILTQVHLLRTDTEVLPKVGTPIV